MEISQKTSHFLVRTEKNVYICSLPKIKDTAKPKKKKDMPVPLRALCAALLLAAIMSSCHDNTPRRYLIGVSQCSGGFWREKQNSEMRRELLFHDDAAIELLCADDNGTKQADDIRRLIDKGADILVVSPHDTDALSHTLAEAYDSGIPVLLFDRTVNSEKYTAFVGGDNEAVGALMAAYVVTRLGNRGGKVLEITGDMHTSPAIQRHRGFTKGLAHSEDIRVVASVDAGWVGPRTARVTDSLLRLYPDVDVIVAHSDYMASEAKKVADSLCPQRTYVFVGADGFGSPGLGVEAVEKGLLDATAIYPTGGDVIIQTALEILRGGRYSRHTLLPSYMVSTPQEARLLTAMDRAITSEAGRVKKMHSLAVSYLEESRARRLMLYAALAALTLICALCAALCRLNMLRRKANRRLHEQQDILIEKNGELRDMARRLEEATNARLMFFTNVSHDFRTPLNLISGPIDRAMAMAEQGGDIIPMLRIAQRNVAVLLDLVNQILDFRKAENGKMTVDIQTADINRLMRGWHESFAPLAQRKGLTLISDIRAEECLANVDVKKLERIVYNLLGNSVKFTPPGGSISLRYGIDKGCLVVTVSDTGPGIGPDSLNRIFERFYRIENSNVEGSGIGLALVKKYAELMGGRVEIQSDCDKAAGETGTRITVTVPSAQPEDGAAVADVGEGLSPESLLACSNLPTDVAEADQTVTEEEKRPVVLVVDDNEDMLSYAASLLRGRYRVLTAADGGQGLRLAKENIPDIVVCDVMMPVMDGLECCRKMKNDVCTSHIPVIMLTACSLDEQRVEGLQSGAEAYLAKPFNSSVLLAQIDTLLKNRLRVSLFKTHDTEDGGDTAEHKEEAVQDDARHSLSRYDRGFLQRLSEHIEENYSDKDFSVETLAEKMCLSRAQLYRKCKALTGSTPVEIIRNSRLEHAREMLLDGYDQIAHVAAAVGIPNATYFTKCYKTYFGSYPKDTMS